MIPSDAYMAGFTQGVLGKELDETGIPDLVLHAFTDGHEFGRTRRQLAEYTAKGFNGLVEVNKKAFAMWNLDGKNPELPSPPSGSGCRFHYCWMPVDMKGNNHSCEAHGGRDCPLPKIKAKKPA